MIKFAYHSIIVATHLKKPHQVQGGSVPWPAPPPNPQKNETYFPIGGMCKESWLYGVYIKITKQECKGSTSAQRFLKKHFLLIFLGPL